MCLATSTQDLGAAQDRKTKLGYAVSLADREWCDCSGYCNVGRPDMVHSDTTT